MKKILYLIIISILLLSVVACQSSEEVSVKAEMGAPGGAPKGGPGMGMPFGGSKPEGGMPPMGQSSSKQTTANAKEATELKDTDGNTIYSGGVRLSFDNRKVVINASYIIDNCTVEITEGEYNTASGSSDEVVFLVINGGKLVIKGSDGNPVVITKSGSASENGHIDDDYNFYGINS
nr:hypothetical protein [Sphaerochaetaceae bacterium]